MPTTIPLCTIAAGWRTHFHSSLFCHSIQFHCSAALSHALSTSCCDFVCVCVLVWVCAAPSCWHSPLRTSAVLCELLTFLAARLLNGMRCRDSQSELSSRISPPTPKLVETRRTNFLVLSVYQISILSQFFRRIGVNESFHRSFGSHFVSLCFCLFSFIYLFLSNKKEATDINKLPHRKPHIVDSSLRRKRIAISLFFILHGIAANKVFCRLHASHQNNGKL